MNERNEKLTRRRSRRPLPGEARALGGRRLQLEVEELMSLTTGLTAGAQRGHLLQSLSGVTKVPGGSAHCGRMQLVQSSVRPAFVILPFERTSWGQGESKGMWGAGAGRRPSWLLPQPGPRRNGIQTKETLGVGGRGVGWLLFIQTRAQQMNRFTKIISSYSMLLKVQTQQCEGGVAFLSMERDTSNGGVRVCLCV